MPSDLLTTPDGNVLLGTLYDAALDPRGWHDAVAALTSWVGGEFGCLQIRRLQPCVGVSMVVTGIDPAFARAYREYYYELDPHLERVGQISVGRTHLSREVLPDEELYRTAYFNEYCRPQGLGDLQGTTLIREPARVVTFATYSSLQQRFDAESRARLDVMIPHLVRCAALMLRAEEATAARHAALATAEMESSGLLRVTETLAVLEGSPGTLEWLGRSACRLWVRDGQLGSNEAREAEALRAGVRSAIAGTPVRLRLDAGVESIGAYITPAPPSMLHGEPAAFVYLALLPPAAGASARSNPRAALSPALERVAVLLSAGLSDKDIAAQLELPLSTARTYVSRVFDKLGVRSRRELLLRR